MSAPTAGRRHRLLAALRLGLGVAGLAAPRLFLRGLGVDPVRQPTAPYLLRLFAVRNAWLAVHLLRPDATGSRSQAVLDLTDAAAALLALRGGQLPPRRAALAVVSGAVAAALAATPSGTPSAAGRVRPLCR